MKILNLETSTSVCSVSLSIDEKIYFKEEHTEKIHASAITVFIDGVIKQAGISYHELDAVAVSKGPGSYTGLRIGVSVAKGLCYALDKPLIGVSTLQAMAAGFSKCLPFLGGEGIGGKGFVICPMIDARRMEVYSAFYDLENNLIRPIQADIIDEHSYADFLAKQKVYFIGNGVLKCKPLLSIYSNAYFNEDFRPSATYLISLAKRSYLNQEFENVAYFEPYYLKDFVTTTPNTTF